ncbi:MAG: hypothetical protein ACXAD7_20430, partial [Candidatus Kariarchaeaceae archaeon]
MPTKSENVERLIGEIVRQFSANAVEAKFPEIGENLQFPMTAIGKMQNNPNLKNLLTLLNNLLSSKRQSISLRKSIADSNKSISKWAKGSNIVNVFASNLWRVLNDPQDNLLNEEQKKNFLIFVRNAIGIPQATLEQAFSILLEDINSFLETNQEGAPTKKKDDALDAITLKILGRLMHTNDIEKSGPAYEAAISDAYDDFVADHPDLGTGVESRISNIKKIKKSISKTVSDRKKLQAKKTKKLRATLKRERKTMATFWIGVNNNINDIAKEMVNESLAGRLDLSDNKGVSDLYRKLAKKKIHLKKRTDDDDMVRDIRELNKRLQELIKQRKKPTGKGKASIADVQLESIAERAELESSVSASKNAELIRMQRAYEEGVNNPIDPEDPADIDPIQSNMPEPALPFQSEAKWSDPDA